MLLYFLIFCAILSFFGSHALNTLSVTIRVSETLHYGAFTSHSREQILKFFSGYLSLFFALISSILIEFNYGVAIFISICTFATFLIFCFLLIVYVDVFTGSKVFNLFLKKIKSLREQKQISKKSFYSKENENKFLNSTLIYHSIISFSFLLLGYIIAFCLAYLYPDYRLSMFQVAAILHGLGTFFSVFFVNRLIARIMEKKEINYHDKTISTLKSFVLGRLISSGIIMIILLIFCVYMILN